MIDVLPVALAFALLVGGVVGSVLPSLPGALLSLAGVVLYRWTTGEPGALPFGALVAAALFTWAVDLLGGAVAARVGGASTLTAAAAGLVGLVLFFVTGPLGIVVGVAGTVFVLELLRGRDAAGGAKAALVTTAGMLASTVAQALLTASILVSMVAVALL